MMKPILIKVQYHHIGYRIDCQMMKTDLDTSHMVQLVEAGQSTYEHQKAIALVLGCVSPFTEKKEKP